MKIQSLLLCSLLAILIAACSKPADHSAAVTTGSGLKIAYVNGDTILHRFDEFRKQSEAMDAKQHAAEDQLQAKGAALQNEIQAYQKKAQSGTMTAKEMEAHEKYLSTRQEAVLAERDKMAKEIMAETDEINKRLQKALHEKLDQIKKDEGYDFILNAAEGGSVLAANEKYDITEQVIKMLNANKNEIEQDTTK